jgi:outer membrane biogenesis lipoprotein LolB
MQLLPFIPLLGILLLGGCGKSDATPTAQQQQQQQAQLDAVRQHLISQLETKLQRPLTDREKACITVKLDDSGRGVMILIMSPLNDEVKGWQQPNAATQPSSPATGPAT